MIPNERGPNIKCWGTEGPQAIIRFYFMPMNKRFQSRLPRIEIVVLLLLSLQKRTVEDAKEGEEGR